jgi:hypothetical protein
MKSPLANKAVERDRAIAGGKQGLSSFEAYSCLEAFSF